MKKSFILFAIIYLFANRIDAQFAGPLNMSSHETNFSQYLSRSTVEKMANAADKNDAVNTFNNRENTKGERFLFNTWVIGDSVKDAQNQLVNTTSYLFNFDKLTGSLLVTENKIDIMSVTSTGINSFTLESKGKRYHFLHVPAIEATPFYLKLTGVDSLYSLYKEYKEKFVKSDYKNDGMIQTGNLYDEYLDESSYYITKPGSSTGRIITLRPKDIKNALVAEKEKVNAYFSQHKEDDINENFLLGLIDYINK